MTRPLFDPERLRGPDKDSAKPANRAMTVTRLSELVESALRDGTPSAVRVIGEVSSINDRTHWYFTLKDESSVVSCVLFRRGKGMRSDKPQIGDEVVVTGRVSYYAPQGRLQLYADAIEPVGAGELDRRFKALCAELRAEGYFDHERKRAIPSFPRRVAVITSRTGAALQDVLDTMRRRCPAVDVLVVDVRVQGDGAARQIGATLNRISKDHASLGVDAVLVTRGGGSMEDLWGFNERPVADAILNCKIPVVAAIGHETDTTVAELVADLRCATPTQAAMRLTPDRDALFQQVNALKARLRDLFGRSLSDQFLFLERSWKRQRLVVSNRMTSAHLRLERLGARLAAHRPAEIYARRRERLTLLAEQLNRINFSERRAADAARAESLDNAIVVRLERERDRLVSLERELAIVGPIRVLSRGYTVTTRPDGSLLRSVHDLAPGETLVTRFADGQIDSVTGGQAAHESSEQSVSEAPPARRPTRRKRTKKKGDDNQPRLF